MRAPLSMLGVALASLALVSCPFFDLGGAARALGGERDDPPQAASGTGRVVPGSAATSAADSPGAAARDVVAETTAGEWPEPTENELAALTTEAPCSAIDPDLALAALARETVIFSQPSWSSKKIGYLRAGAVVRRGPEPAGYDYCSGGWYRIAPEGYVCVGKTATLDLEHPVVRASRTPPDRSAALPYIYGQSRFPTPPFYVKVPSAEEQQHVELDLARHLRFSKRGAWDSVPFQPVPDFLQGGRPGPSLHGYVHSSRSVYTGRALLQSGYAFLSFFESGGRRFGLSADLSVMPLDRLKPVKASEFHGLALDDRVTLPVVFVRSHNAFLYRRETKEKGGGLSIERRLRYREAVPITGQRIRIGSARFLETRKGTLLREVGLVRVNPMRNRPNWATPGRTWVDISILRQVLVAYEGTKPVYVTLVSTGADELGDPEQTHSTVLGRFLIHTKHVTATMSGDEVGDEFDLRDVPYVQYFTEGYAIHASYWHNSFGVPRSHGCINLAPRDAHWLFQWTDPPVPEGWHAALSLRDGTLVNVHP